jgi:hypothetical protein
MVVKSTVACLFKIPKWVKLPARPDNYPRFKKCDSCFCKPVSQIAATEKKAGTKSEIKNSPQKAGNFSR